MYEPARGRCNWKKWLVWAWRLEVPRGTTGFNIGLNLPRQAMGRTANLVGNRHRRRLPRRVLALVVQSHPYRTGTDLRTKFVRRLARHDSSLLESQNLQQTRGG